AVALAGQLVRNTIGIDLNAELVALTLTRRGVDAQQRQLAGREVLGRENVPHLLRADLAALVVGVLLDHPAELDLQPARQGEAVLGLHYVRDAALAGLRVDPDHGLVAAADVLRVDRQVRRLPGDVADRLA